ncbi:MAG TPA: prenyltransferase/squalene oxidase repeat-containing protein [Solirubrobacterales bacterium]|nr:prenyltransferase/squalene oxidase repeat-containing protein [Solirubrobacterales bacterium]
MSWELASFLILAAVLVAGFAWYERSRPPAQVVALVAALAALAIAGRIAFAAFPNVKPTTDIVFFAGFALGPAAGFAVGALAALVSNFWFGQGPWTPWQMAGWGMCGIFGAVLALGWRHAGRLTLAAACGFAGIAYGALLNFSLMATYGGELSLERFGVLQARALPFDAAHAIGNVAFALLAGPALVRMLTRFRERFEWQRGGGFRPNTDTDPDREPPSPGRGPGLRGSVAALLAVAAVLALLPAPASASDVSRAAAFLAASQNRDGGFGPSPDDDSGAETTAWAMLGLAAAGRNPLDVTRRGRSPVDFLRANEDEIKSPGGLARTILALQAAGLDPREFAGRNFVAELIDRRRGNGSWEGWPGSTAFAVVALRSAGAGGGVSKSLDWLRRVQNEDGGWGDVPGSPSTADGTGAAMQALSPDSKAVHRGIVFLRREQRVGGGFPLGGSGPTNTQSTAWAMQGILAAGGDPANYKRGGDSAYEYLSQRQEEDGSYRYSGSSDQTPVWVTGQVLVAAAGKFFPLAAPAREPKPKPTTTAKKQGKASSERGPTSAPTIPSPGAGSTGLPGTGPGRGGGGIAPGVGGSSGAGTGGSGGGTGPTLPPGAEAPPLPGTEAPLPTEEVPAPEGSADPAAIDTGEEAGSEESDRSAAGAIFLGLVAGGLIFAAAWGGRRGWMHWRYGL